MADHVTAERRSHTMSKVGQKDAKPELALRRALHQPGCRFRLHRRDLPGSPDIVFPSRKQVVFVHRCFWHGHGCRLGRLPKSRSEYWKQKIATNKERDKRALTELREAGWEPLVVWQCELRDLKEAVGRVEAFLRS